MRPCIGEVIDLDALSDDELLLLHREVCRRAARIYGVRYASIQRQNYRAAMAIKDTRFIQGLSALDNVKRVLAMGRKAVA